MIVSKSFRGKAIHGRRGNSATERTELTKPRVIDQDQQDIRRTLGSFRGLGKLRRIGLKISATNLTWKAEIGPRQHGRCACECFWLGRHGLFLQNQARYKRKKCTRGVNRTKVHATLSVGVRKARLRVIVGNGLRRSPQKHPNVTFPGENWMMEKPLSSIGFMTSSIPSSCD